jgi:hypothetical protein
MKVLDIALKDLLRSFRSAFALVMMFVVPLLVTGIIYFAFGGLGSDDGGFDLPVTRVQVVNLDQPDFTAAVTAPGGSAVVTLYQDPTLTLGPGIVKDLVSQFLDGFVGFKIATSVVADQLGQRGVEADAGLMQDVALQYAAWAEALEQSRGERTHPALDIQPPPGETEPVGQETAIMGAIMAGMLIFFTFLTGASTAETIIREDEEGTLARLFTTPTPRAVLHQDHAADRPGDGRGVDPDRHGRRTIHHRHSELARCLQHRHPVYASRLGLARLETGAGGRGRRRRAFAGGRHIGNGHRFCCRRRGSIPQAVRVGQVGNLSTGGTLCA